MLTCVSIYSGGKKIFDPLLICTFAHWQRNYQSIILMVGFLNSERQNNNNKIQKYVFQKSYKLICILMSQISMIPYQSARFLAPRCFYTGKELRGALS